MISLDQVLLLQQKVESAVQKIAQLNAENDALRTKCSELTNALSAKTEQVSAFEADQHKIEEGILKALDRLNTVENSVLKAVGQVPTPTLSSEESSVQTFPSETESAEVIQQVKQEQNATNNDETSKLKEESDDVVVSSEQDQNSDLDQDTQEDQNTSGTNLQFDIF